jgi:serine/threonine-protein kinase RsbW
MINPEKNGNVIHLSLPSRLELLGVVDKIADGITEYLGFEDVDRDAVAISVIEACTNAIQHGHQASTIMTVSVTFTIEKDSLTIEIEDTGEGFRPATEDEMSPPDLLATRGRGIFIMRSMMDEVDFDFSKGTKVSMVKRRSKETSAEKGAGGDGE